MARKHKRKKRKTQGRSNLEKFIEEQVLNFFKRNKEQAFTPKHIASATGLYDQVPNNKIRSVMDRIAERGKLEYLDRGKYRLGSSGQILVGKIQLTRSGAGFLLVDDDEDIFISPDRLGKTLDGDTVKVRVLSTRRKKSGRASGEVLEVLERNRIHFVGTIQSEQHIHFLVSDDNRMRMDFYISNRNLNGAKSGDKVVAELLNWERRSPEVGVKKIIGRAGEHQTEMHAILYHYGFDPIFPPEVEAEAEGIPAEISAAEISKRKDMREVPTFTIDPIDAKDFDDALSIRTLENGRYEVGVHIADVSHYVRPGTDIDREAFQRGTSVYLVDRTVPMLPEKLSNEVCSLRPEEEKLTYSAIFELDEEAKIHKQWFGRTVIYSDYRFHYGEAEEVLKGEKDHQFREQLLTLNRLAYKLREKRFATGSIDFDTDEVKFVLDDQDKPIGVTKKARGDSNRLIEDFMLLANRKVAEFISNKEQGSPLPFVYRVHDRPDPDKLTNLQEFVKAFGYKVDFSDEKHTSHVMKQLLEKVDGRPEENVIENIAIRSMAKAVYTTKNVGHYGLGFAHYTHFTSPIRRYPDLLVHRLMEKYLHGTYDQNPVILEEQLKHSSNRERIAVEAERTSIKYKQVEYLSDKIGEEFEGVISGVIEKGVFVELVETLCEGLVPVFTIEGDYFFYDEDNYCMRGRETGMVLQLGDPVIVKITGTDMGKRTIDMELVKKLEPVGEVLK